MRSLISLHFILRNFVFVGVFNNRFIILNFPFRDPTYFTLTRIHQNVYGDVSLRIQNLDILVKHLRSYYQVRMEFRNRGKYIQLISLQG